MFHGGKHLFSRFHVAPAGNPVKFIPFGIKKSKYYTTMIIRASWSRRQFLGLKIKVFLESEAISAAGECGKRLAICSSARRLWTATETRRPRRRCGWRSTGRCTSTPHGTRSPSPSATAPSICPPSSAGWLAPPPPFLRPQILTRQ
jgi:hypothetical protein